MPKATHPKNGHPMGISNVGSGLRSGVCTSTTRPSAPYEGQMIYETDTNRVLVWDNAAWVMIADTDTPPGLQLVATKTLSGTSTQVDSCFTTEFDSYRLVLSNFTFSTESLVTLRLVAGTTPNTDNSYYTAGFQVVTGGTLTGIGSGPTTYFYTAASASPTASGLVVDIYNPKLSVGTGINLQGTDTRTNGAPYRASGGFFNGTNSFDGIWIGSLNGSYTLGGTVRVYGYRN